MFSRLRLRLTVLYLGVAVVLVVVLVGATYALVNYYFESSTLLTLQRRMAHEFRERNLPLPAEIAQADRAWQANHIFSPPAPADHNKDNVPSLDTNAVYADEDTTGELAAVTLLVLDRNGQKLAPIDGPDTQRISHRPAVDAAFEQGNDQRVIQTSNGLRLHLLTYYLGNAAEGDKPVFIQLSRSLADQDHILRQMLMGLTLLGASSVVLLGVGSWWMAGRSIHPAQRTWEMQQMFVSNASHELRTPLTLIRASAETLQQNLVEGVYDADDNRTLLEDVLKECDHTAHVVSDLLLLSRLDARNVSMTMGLVSLTDLLLETQRQTQALAEEQGVHLVVTPVLVSSLAWGDAGRIRQVLLILLDNALKHTPSGGTITLSAENGKNTARLTVADSGSGISPVHLSHVFDRFYQADAAHSNKGSSGLGLSIAKALVEAQHGSIALKSQLGIGTQVVVTLPTRG